MKKILLPDGVADSWFHVTAGGEVYESRICRGRDLYGVLAELMFGSKDAEHSELDEIATNLSDPDFWWSRAGRCLTCSIACGEDPDIEICLIADPILTTLSGTLEKAQHALTWSNPEGGECCAGKVTHEEAEQAYEDATEAVHAALARLR